MPPTHLLPSFPVPTQPYVATLYPPAPCMPHPVVMPHAYMQAPCVPPPAPPPYPPPAWLAQPSQTTSHELGAEGAQQAGTSYRHEAAGATRPQEHRSVRVSCRS
eukprot:1161965-Pelagomonas_calceolata.AAC.15